MNRETDYYAFRQHAYAMKKHHASRLHYDLRLEWDGVLLSWALPQGPSCEVGLVRTAIEMEDHRRKYLQFEGVHKTGPIMLWDLGTWEPHPESNDINRSLREGVLRFTLRGEKLLGGWTLFRTDNARNARRPIWALYKDADLFGGPTGSCVLERLPNSVSSGRSMEEIVRDWTIPKRRPKRQMSLF